MNTISVQRGPRPSNESCGLPSILDQFAKSRPPLAQLKHPLVTPPLRASISRAESGAVPDRLARDQDPFKLRQLLAGQRRTKITILAAEQFARPFADARRERDGSRPARAGATQALRRPRPDRPEQAA